MIMSVWCISNFPEFAFRLYILSLGQGGGYRLFVHFDLDIFLPRNRLIVVHVQYFISIAPDYDARRQK